ncbi:FAD-linked oxidase [Rhodococcus opacus M213]|uniref:FAD-linked oxidase n=1 Tax=Rhodococcus opacus M213 TaxID=1129896 RepID=K8XTK1_RHOOP|nr:FAD-linked oxidase [Rhodococcus opacus M213]
MGTQNAVLLNCLRAIVGDAHVITDAITMQSYTIDWTGRWQGEAVAVVRPGTTDEVSAVVAACHERRIPITAQGGNTGLVGGAIPSAGSIVLSTQRLNSIDTIDPVGRIIAAGAGVTVAMADDAASKHGLQFGIDLASRDSATLGGIVATNAGGVRMVRHGNTRAQLLGVEAVLSDGAVLSRWIPLVKDNVGYDLPGLLAGSEGTLAIITKVLMKLTTPPPETQVVLAGVSTIEAALNLCDRMRRHGLTVEAAEIMTTDGVALVCSHSDARHPFGQPSPLYTLIEISSSGDTEATVLEILSASADTMDDAIVEPGPARKLWQIRESHTECISRASSTPVVKLDVAVPLPEMSTFITALESALAAEFSEVTPILFGHFADGNIHVNILNVPTAASNAITDRVFEIVAAHHGSISAEHGIGRAKKSWITLGRSPVDIRIMKQIKSALDPRCLLNPDVLLPTASAESTQT